MKRSLVTLCFAIIGTVFSAVSAQKDVAIDLAAAHPALKPLLALHEDWSADAYNTRNGYGIWRVQFYFPGGEELGWADVSPKAEKVYAWEASYELTGRLQERTQRALYRFVRRSPEVRALVGDPAPLEKSVRYDSWREGWFVHLKNGPDALDVSIRSRVKGSLKLTDLFIEKIYFPNTLKLGEYRAAQRSGAVALAFANPDIAAALREKPGWKGDGTLLGGDVWQVLFFQNEQEVASAVVDLSAQRVGQISVTP